MNILISTWSLAVGGGEIFAMNLAAELAARGHQVYVFNQRAHLIDHSVVKRLLPPSVKVLSMADKPFGSYVAHKLNALQHRITGNSSYFDQQQQAYFNECLRRYDIDVVSSHATFSDAMCVPAMQKGTPLVITEHGEYTIFTLEGRFDFAPVLRQATAIVTVSDYCQRRLRQCFEELPPMQTIYNGVVTDLSHRKAQVRATLGIEPEAFVFGMAARGVAQKGWEQAIDAFRQVRAAASRPVHYVLVGGSDYMEELKKQFGTEPGLHFTGRVPNPDFYMAGSDVGLLPSYFPSEALPLSVIEYMTYGLPTIATNIGGIPELIGRAGQEAGLLVELSPETRQPDVAQLRDAMQRYLTDEAFYAGHAAHALELSQSFTMAACAEQYEQVFAQAISSTRTAPATR